MVSLPLLSDLWSQAVGIDQNNMASMGGESEVPQQGCCYRVRGLKTQETLRVPAPLV